MIPESCPAHYLLLPTTGDNHSLYCSQHGQDTPAGEPKESQRLRGPLSRISGLSCRVRIRREYVYRSGQRKLHLEMTLHMTQGRPARRSEPIAWH